MRLGATASPETPLGGPCELLRVRLPWDGLAPERAALLVRGESQPFALIGRWAGGGALIGSDPVAVAQPDADPFALLETMPPLASGSERRAEGPSDAGAKAGSAVGGGWFGYLGHGLGAEIERLDPQPPSGGPCLPAFSLAFYDHLLHQDAGGHWWFEALLTPEREDAIRGRLEAFRSRPVRSCPSRAHPVGATWTAAEEPRRFSTKPWRSTPSPPGHGRAVAACRERIHAGDLFQANICQRLSSRLTGDPLDVFVTAVPVLTPDRAGYLAGPWGAIASLSPELFLERHGSRVRTAPIKGTRPRPGDPVAAERQRSELASSAKDRAENQMIVDMARNDLGRVCLYGTVQVETTAEPRPHTGVWHLVSQVAGELHPELGDRALLRATFPPASVTGAPKIAAQNVIAELESTRREVYTGAIGFASPLAGLELSVAIRSFEFGPAPQPGAAPDAGRETWLGVGGGIVADSEPAEEAEECRTKAMPLLSAIGAELALPADRAAVRETGGGSPQRRDRLTVQPPSPFRLGSRPTPRPDPAAGVFETILVEAGRPLHLDRHLARLATSVAQLYRAELPPGLRADIERAATLPSRSAQRPVSPPPGRSRLRVDLRPVAEAKQGHGAATGLPTALTRPQSVTSTIRVSPLEERPPPSLAPVCLPGGLGSHKWADRALLSALADAVQPHTPLLCDLEGQVLEAAHASVFAEFADGRLVTPPLDGRILPSVARARIVAAEIALPVGRNGALEAPLTLADLAKAKAIYIANALNPALRKVHVEPDFAER